MRRFCLVAAALLVLSGCREKGKVVVGMTTLATDTVWSGIVKVEGDVYVPPGVTLTILPGTTVKFSRIDEKSGKNLFGLDSPYYPQAELIVRGRLVAQGTKDDIIVFTSAEKDARPSDWGAINFLGSTGNVVEYCKILFAYNGIHAHGSQMVISHNEFSKNGVAISVKKEEEFPDMPWYGREAEFVITHNRMMNNKGGVTFRNSRGVVSYNTIRDNKFFGVWPKEKSNVLVSCNDITGNAKGVYLYKTEGLAIHRNNIHGNSEYNIAIADEQERDVDARDNWFGTINPKKIDELVFDRSDDQAVARITWQPALKSKVRGSGR